MNQSTTNQSPKRSFIDHLLSKALVLPVICLVAGCQPDNSDESAATPKPETNLVSRSSNDSNSSNSKSNPVNKPKSKPKSEPKKIISVVINDPAFHEALLSAANDYIQYPMVNTAAMPAPEVGALAMEPPTPLMSDCEDESSHGQKLYYLFAKETAHYLDQDSAPTPVGQTIVIESWTSKPSNADARNLRNHASGNRINPRTKVGDRILEIGKRKDLFVMMKLEPDTPGTDQGWIYGVVSPDAETVSKSGKVTSCMQCHEEKANNDRLFGMATAAQ